MHSQGIVVTWIHLGVDQAPDEQVGVNCNEHAFMQADADDGDEDVEDEEEEARMKKHSTLLWRLLVTAGLLAAACLHGQLVGWILRLASQPVLLKLTHKYDSPKADYVTGDKKQA